jgi:hypothetical protein
MQPDQQPQRTGSKISNTEWGLVIGAAAVVDIAQIVLDIVLVGPFINWLIDIFVGLSLTFYYHIRGVKLDSKKIAVIIVTFVLEEFGLGVAPLWWADVTTIMLMDKTEKSLMKITPYHPDAAKLAKKATDMAPQKRI